MTTAEQQRIKRTIKQYGFDVAVREHLHDINDTYFNHRRNDYLYAIRGIEQCIRNGQDFGIKGHGIDGYIAGHDQDEIPWSYLKNDWHDTQKWTKGPIATVAQ